MTNEENAPAKDDLISLPFFDGAPPPHAVENVRRGLFMMAVSGAFMPIWFGVEETWFVGDRKTGRFILTNARGQCSVFAWDSRGVVALSFEEEDEVSVGDDGPVILDPMRHFVGIPKQLGALAHFAVTATHATQQDLTCGLWLTSEGGRYTRLSSEEQLAPAAYFIKLMFEDEVPQGGEAAEGEQGSDGRPGLADEDPIPRIARTGVVEPEDAGALFRACEGREPTEEELLCCQGKLADLGITWADPVADWRRF